jgi:predicted AlkP superfamily pyrophosphatase or phosphodiesterase
MEGTPVTIILLMPKLSCKIENINIMRKTIVTGMLILAALTAFGQKAAHVVIISIDGFRPDFYLDESWGMTNLRQLKSGGVYAEGVNSIFPSVTFPNHTSMITGVESDEHGIYFNKPEPDGESHEWYWFYKDIKVPTLWDAVRSAGMTSASINWPVSVGAPVDYNIPIVKEAGKTRLEAIGKNCTPAGLLEEVQENATGKMDAVDFAMEKDYLVLDENLARISAYLIREYKPNLTMVRLSCVDHCQHLQGREGNMVRRAVSGVDRAIRTIVESIERAGIKEKTAIIVAGDHGFVDRHTAVAPNVWLAEAGLIRDLKSRDWKARFYQNGGSAFLLLKDDNDRKTLRKVKEILAKVPENQKKLFHVVEQEELEEEGTAPHSPLALTAVQGVAFSGSFTGEAVKSAKGGTHGYFPDFKEIQTGFIGYGAGFQAGKVIPVMDIEDIAPMVANLLGVELVNARKNLYPGILSIQK